MGMSKNKIYPTTTATIALVRSPTEHGSRIVGSDQPAGGAVAQRSGD